MTPKTSEPPPATAGAAPLVSGFRVRSGRAVAVLLAGPSVPPRLLDRTEVPLSDPRRPETVQPYHAGFGALETDHSILEGRREAIRSAAARSVGALLHRWQDLGAPPTAASVVVGSTTPPESIHNEHMRAHALEGALFRSVLVDGLTRHGIGVEVLEERAVRPLCAERLGTSAAGLETALTAMGRVVGPPWRADHKLAAAAAWYRLAG